MKRDPSNAAGEFIRAHVSGDVDPSAHVASRTRFVEEALGQRSRGTASRRIAIFAVLAGLTAVLIWGASTFRTPMTFARGPSRALGVVSEYMISPSTEDLPLYFSDGSVVTLDPSTRARVERAAANGAVLLVESGRLSANVVHRSESDWRFLAGPYSVHVTGTAFVLSWQLAGVLDIEMKSGVVVVTGPGIDSSVEVRGHRRFVMPGAPASTATNAPNPLPEAWAPQSGSAPLPREGLSPSASAAKSAQDLARTQTDTRHAVPEAPPNESWASLVARGEYARVLGLANARGIDATLASGTLDDLAALADAARFSGDRNVAERSLGEVRSRFPGTPRAQSSTFLLGRIADDAGDARSAVSWYERYLNEAPGGSLAADASGRRMLALRRLNESEKARRAALEYLERFPTGPHANIARDIVGP